MKKMRSVPYLKIRAQSKRLLLRPYKLTDFSNCRDSHRGRRSSINRFDESIPTPSSKTYREFKKRLERHRRHGKMGVHYLLAIFEKKSRQYIGQIDLFLINKQLRWGNLGYCVHNQFWGSGYATEACGAALKVAFSKLGFHRIEAATEPRNKASIQVAKKLGMTYEGKRRKFFPDKGGIDLVVYGSNAIDFKKRRNHKAKR